MKASYNSFVVSEHPEHVTLFPGLIIPEMRLDFGTGDSAQCSTKVVAGEADTWFMSILDMPILDQRKLFSFLEKETGMKSAISVNLDPEDLLRFFFEAGFVYPEKYAGVASSRERLKEMVSRLYIDAPSISQHFVQDDRGIIEAHISMVRFYERTWIIHHHAALVSGAGATVLAQIFRYVNSYSPLPSTHMDYLRATIDKRTGFQTGFLGDLPGPWTYVISARSIPLPISISTLLRAAERDAKKRHGSLSPPVARISSSWRSSTKVCPED